MHPHELFTMTKIKYSIIIFLIASAFSACNDHPDIQDADFNGTYCFDDIGAELTIVQEGSNVTFLLEFSESITGTGTLSGNKITLTGELPESNLLTCHLTLSDDGQNLSGTYEIADHEEVVFDEGTLNAIKGECALYDIQTYGIPKFAGHDFTQLDKIDRISEFRSAYGHSYTDDFESCRSMKHYYWPNAIYRLNNTIAIYAPADGTIISITNEQHGSSTGLTNKQIHIKPADQPAFTIILFHCDLLSDDITENSTVEEGDLLGYARMYYNDLNEYASNFDIAVRVNTPTGSRLVSYFNILEDAVFNNYVSRGASSRQDFIISKEARDADPLECDEETFLTTGSLSNWFELN